MFPVSCKTNQISFQNVLSISHKVNCPSTNNTYLIPASPFSMSTTFYQNHYSFPDKEVIGIMVLWTKFCIVFRTKTPGCFGFPVSQMELITMRCWTALSVGVVFTVRHCIYPRVGRRPRGLIASPESHLLFINFSVWYISAFMSQASLCAHIIIKVLNAKAQSESAFFRMSFFWRYDDFML